MYKNRTRSLLLLGLIVAYLTCVAGCEDGGVVSEFGTSSHALQEGLDLGEIDGNFRAFLTDAPADFEEVWVTFDRVDLHRVASEAGGDAEWVTVVDAEQTLDLLELRDGVTAAIGDATLPPGEYNQVRMFVTDAEVVQDGEVRPLTIPSAVHSGVKIVNLNLTVEAGRTYVLVVDFDAAKSIHEAGKGKLVMRPVLKAAYVAAVPEGDDDDDDDDNAYTTGDAEMPAYYAEPPAEGDGSGDDGQFERGGAGDYSSTSGRE